MQKQNKNTACCHLYMKPNNVSLTEAADTNVVPRCWREMGGGNGRSGERISDTKSQVEQQLT